VKRGLRDPSTAVSRIEIAMVVLPRRRTIAAIQLAEQIVYRYSPQYGGKRGFVTLPG